MDRKKTKGQSERSDQGATASQRRNNVAEGKEMVVIKEACAGKDS